MADPMSDPHQLLDATSEGLLLLNDRNRVAYANRPAAQFFGRARGEDLLATAFADLVPDAGTGDDAVVMIRTADGGTRPVRLRTRAGAGGSRVVTIADVGRASDHLGLARLLEFAPVGVAILDGPEQVYAYANKHYRELFGPRDFVGRRLGDVLPEVVAHGRTALFDDVYRYGHRRVARERVLQLVEPDGRSHGYILNITYEPLRDVDGRVTGIMVVLFDVTDEVLARDLIGYGGQSLRQVLDASPAIIWLTDDRGRCTYISRKWYEQTGRVPVGCPDDCWYEDIHPDDVAEARARFDRAVSAREALRLEYRVRGRDGTDRLVINVGFPRHDRRGRFLGHVGTLVEANDRTRFLSPRERGLGR